jgi:hypothetical protein
VESSKTLKKSGTTRLGDRRPNHWIFQFEGDTVEKLNLDVIFFKGGGLGTLGLYQKKKKSTLFIFKCENNVFFFFFFFF